MPNYVELTPEELHAATSREVMAEAAAEDRIPGGKYLLKTNSYVSKRVNDDDQYNPGRQLATLRVSYLNRNDPTKVVGNAFVDVSWEPRYRRDGKLDAMAKRFTDLAKALGVRSESNPLAVLSAATQQLVEVTLRETFRVAAEDVHAVHAGVKSDLNGEAWVNVPSAEKGGEEIYEHYFDLGYESKVQIDKITKVK